MRRRLLLVAWVIGVGLGGLVGAAAPATAQVPPPVTIQAGTWSGVVVTDAGHFDYLGSPCPVEIEICTPFIVQYLIAPTTAQAARALPSVAGGRAALTGLLVPVTVGSHQGILLVSRVVPVP